MNRVRDLTRPGWAVETVDAIGRVFRHLAERLRSSVDAAELAPLRTLAWLPAKGKRDRLYRPSELYSTYSYVLFSSQALFLDLALNIEETRNLLVELGVPLAPSTEQVVQHLLFCAKGSLSIVRFTDI